MFVSSVRMCRWTGMLRKDTCGFVIGVFICVCLLLNSSCGFNLEVEFPDVRTGSAGSMFGFSVAQHMDQGEGW